MAMTKKQVRVLQVWLWLGAALTLFPPQQVEVINESHFANAPSRVTHDTTILHGFILHGSPIGRTYSLMRMDHAISLNWSGVATPTLLTEIGFITFVCGSLFLTFRTKGGIAE